MIIYKISIKQMYVKSDGILLFKVNWRVFVTGFLVGDRIDQKVSKIKFISFICAPNRIYYDIIEQYNKTIIE